MIDNNLKTAVIITFVAVTTTKAVTAKIREMKAARKEAKIAKAAIQN